MTIYVYIYIQYVCIYISEMSRKVIVILKTSGKKWSEIQSELQNENSTTVSKRNMQKICIYI